jgi:hypothetical protein
LLEELAVLPISVVETASFDVNSPVADNSHIPGKASLYESMRTRRMRWKDDGEAFSLSCSASPVSTANQGTFPIAKYGVALSF